MNCAHSPSALVRFRRGAIRHDEICENEGSLRERSWEAIHALDTLRPSLGLGPWLCDYQRQAERREQADHQACPFVHSFPFRAWLGIAAQSRVQRVLTSARTVADSAARRCIPSLAAFT